MARLATAAQDKVVQLAYPPLLLALAPNSVPRLCTKALWASV